MALYSEVCSPFQISTDSHRDCRKCLENHTIQDGRYQAANPPNREAYRAGSADLHCRPESLDDHSKTCPLCSPHVQIR